MYAMRVIVPAFCVNVKIFFCEMSKKSAAAVLDRLHVVFTAKNDSALAVAMNVSRSTLGGWRTRGTVPYEECVNLAEERSLSLDWLLTGWGQMQRGESGLSVDGEREGAMLALLRALPEDDQQELLLIAQSKKLMRDMERRLDGLVNEINAFRMAASVPI